MSELTIHLLGQFQVLLNGAVITNFASDKVRALLVYLIIEGQHPHRREKLANLFWPEKSESAARTNLRRALVDLRTAIDDYAAEPPHLLITRQDIQFNPESTVWIDCYQFEQLVELGCNCQEDCDHCSIILDLYQGKFLDGFTILGSIAFEEWLQMMRDQYERKVVKLLQQVIQYHVEQAKCTAALPYAWRLVKIVPWQDSARCQLMQLLSQTGKRKEALEQFEQLERILKNELGIRPESETVQLMKQIRDGNLIIENPNQVDPLRNMPEILKSEPTRPVPIEKRFFGRKKELDRLHERLGHALELNFGSAHFISGEAGAGKTYILTQFIQQAQSKDKTIAAAVGSCNAYTGIGDPYLPFREMLSQLCGDFEPPLRAQTVNLEYAQRLWKNSHIAAKAVLNYGRELIETIVPGYIFLDETIFGQYAVQDWYQKLKAITLEKQKNPPSTQSPLLNSQIVKVLQQIANVTPLILAIEDLHWADMSTINLLMYMCKRNRRGIRILLVGAFRSEEVFLPPTAPPHPLIPVFNEFERNFTYIHTKIDAASRKQFMVDLINLEPTAMSQKFYDVLYEITGGNALYIVDIFRAFIDNGKIKKNEKGQWVESGQNTFDEMPSKINWILRQRIQRLPPKVQEDLRIASIEGDTFNAEVIAHVTGHKKEEIVQLLNRTVAQEHHLIQIQQTPFREKNPFTVFKFQHKLYQKYLYDSLNTGERTLLHGQVGTALEALTKEVTDPYTIQLARHFHEAGLLEKAISYYVQAAERAIRMVGFQEAKYLYETALALNQQLPTSIDRDHQELMLQMELSFLHAASWGIGHENVKKANDRIWELCQTVEENQLRLDALAQLYGYLASRADYERLLEIEALKEKILSEMKGIPLIETYRQGIFIGWIDFRFARFKSSAQNFRMAVNAFYESQESENDRIGPHAEIICHSSEAHTCCVLGNFQQAIDNRDKILQIPKTLNVKVSLVVSIIVATRINRWLHEYEKCEPLLNQVQELTGEEYYLNPDYEIFGRWINGFIHLHRKEYDHAIEEFTKTTHGALKAGCVSEMNLNYRALADVYQKKGDLANANHAIAKAVEYQKRTGETLHLSRIARIQGNILRSEGNLAAAEEHYLEAIQIAQGQSAKLFELYAVEDLGRLWYQQGKTEQAQQRLSEMLAQFDGQPDVGIIREAKALLETFQIKPIIG